MKPHYVILGLLLALLAASCSTEKWLNKQLGPNSANKKLLDSTLFSLTKNAVAGGNSEVRALSINLIIDVKKKVGKN